jgi:hypothetical protein
VVTLNRVFLDKIGDGVAFKNHSVLSYLALNKRKKTYPYAISINADNVLGAYHTNLIPKAIEYSAGILDYFFRGQLGVLPYLTPSGAIFLEVTNISGQRLSSGTFTVYADAADGTRTSVGALQAAWGSSETLEDGATRDFTFAEPTPPPTNYVVVYQGTIGTGPGPSYSPLDSVDATISIAAKSFYLQTPGNVIALHTMLGRPPFRHSDIHSASDTTTDAGGWADHTATAPDLTWMAGFCDWLAGFGDDPGYDPDDVVNGYYQVSELKVTVNFDDGGDAVVYDHIAKVGPHTGVWPGTVVYEFATAWDTVLGWGQEYTYQLNDDGTHWTVGNKDNFASPSASVTEAIPTYWPNHPPMSGDYVTSDTSSVSVTKNQAVWTQSTSTYLGHSLVVTYTFALSSCWNVDSMQTELDMLLAQVSLNPAAKYQIEDDPTSPRELLAGGESITVTHEGPQEGVPLRIILRSNGAWDFEAAGGWLAFNLNDVVYGAIQTYGDDGVPEGSGTGVYYRGGPWAMMKSVVAIPAGDYTKTVKAYQPPIPDTVDFDAARDPVSPVPPNNDAGGWNPPTAGPADAATSLSGGVKQYFPRGAWITLTKVVAGP